MLEVCRQKIENRIGLGMRNKTNIVILLIAFALLVASCTPQIRFASRKNIGLNNSHFSKNLQKATTEKGLDKDYFLNLALSNKELDSKRKEVLTFAESWLGTPYCYGGLDKNCTDCSGFVKQIYDMAGINLPRTAALQYDFGKELDDNDTNPGDLVFFRRNNKISHVGIYIGNKQFIHASTNKGVVLQSLEDDFYRQNFAGFKKVL
jgi:cell wall-associated NlpC family hydrolase